MDRQADRDRETETERDRDRDRETERERERVREREMGEKVGGQIERGFELEIYNTPGQ